MKAFQLLALLALCGLGSCDKVRDGIAQVRKKTTAALSAATAGPLVSDIADGGYFKFTGQAGKLVIVDFYADWCGPCRQLSPILEKIAAAHGGTIVVGKVNIDKCKALASQQGVLAIPDVRIFRDGKQVDQFIGLPAESELRRRLEILAQGLKASAPAADGKDAPVGAPSQPTPKKPVFEPMTKDWLPPGIQPR